MQEKEGRILGPLLQKLARRVGARVVIEPTWRHVGQITFRSGRRRYFRYNALDLNPVGSSEVATDKDFSYFFMRRMGYPTPPGKAFYSKAHCEAIGSKRNATAAYRYAKKMGFPVIVKPNSGSQGKDVHLAHDKKGLQTALRAIFLFDRVALVQKFLPGRDYRIVVLDDSVISAYERIPLNVVGDGRSTIRQLLRRKARSFARADRDTSLKTDDPRISRKLALQNLTFSSRPRKGERVYLLDNANLSCGGDATDVTRRMHPRFRELAIRLTKDMGLRLCGVDVLVDGDIQHEPARYWILEVNAAPGLDHYVKNGAAQKRIVEKLYLKVLKHLAK